MLPFIILSGTPAALKQSPKAKIIEAGEDNCV